MKLVKLVLPQTLGVRYYDNHISEIVKQFSEWVKKEENASISEIDFDLNAWVVETGNKICCWSNGTKESCIGRIKETAIEEHLALILDKIDFAKFKFRKNNKTEKWVVKEA